MNHTHQHNQPNPLHQLAQARQLAKDHQIDEILVNEAPLLPTSGFALSVMDSIRAEAANSPSNAFAPIPFPWKRLLPGAILAFSLLIWLLVKFPLSFFAELHAESFQISAPSQLPLNLPSSTILWIAVALAASLLPILLVRKFMGRSALL